MFERASHKYYQELDKISQELNEKISNCLVIGINNLALKINNESTPDQVRATVREIGLHVNGMKYLVPNIHRLATEIIHIPLKNWSENFSKEHKVDHKIFQDLWSCDSPFQLRSGIILWEELYISVQSQIEQNIQRTKW